MKSPNPPTRLKAPCFHCRKLITIKYVRASGDYSQKNNWEYWTKTEENKDKYVCDDCLIGLYRNHKWEFRRLIPDKKKQTLFRQYVINGTISGQPKAVFAKPEDCLVECPNCGKKKKKNQG